MCSFSEKPEIILVRVSGTFRIRRMKRRYGVSRKCVKVIIIPQVYSSSHLPSPFPDSPLPSTSKFLSSSLTTILLFQLSRLLFNFFFPFFLASFLAPLPSPSPSPAYFVPLPSSPLPLILYCLHLLVSSSRSSPPSTEAEGQGREEGPPHLPYRAAPSVASECRA